MSEFIWSFLIVLLYCLSLSIVVCLYFQALLQGWESVSTAKLLLRYILHFQVSHEVDLVSLELLCRYYVALLEPTV